MHHYFTEMLKEMNKPIKDTERKFSEYYLATGFENNTTTWDNKVIFNPPATILYKNGKKYVAKCSKEDDFNEELGLAMCLLKSLGVTYTDFKKLLKNAKRQTKD